MVFDSVVGLKTSRFVYHDSSVLSLPTPNTATREKRK
jgi:hypothetical protein